MVPDLGLLALQLDMLRRTSVHRKKEGHIVLLCKRIKFRKLSSQVVGQSCSSLNFPENFIPG